MGSICPHDRAPAGHRRPRPRLRAAGPRVGRGGGAARRAGIFVRSHMMADVTARHSSGLSAVPSAAQPCASPRDGPPAVRELRRMQARRDSFGRAWVVRAGWAGWMGRTSDARKEIAFPSHQGGAGRAHVEGERLGRMFRAGRHAGYMPWSPEGRGPGSGAPH